MLCHLHRHAWKHLRWDTLEYIHMYSRFPIISEEAPRHPPTFQLNAKWFRVVQTLPKRYWPFFSTKRERTSLKTRRVPRLTFIYPNSFRWLGPRMRRQTDRIFWETLQLQRKFFPLTSTTRSAIQFSFCISPFHPPCVCRLRLIFLVDVHIGAIDDPSPTNIDICVNPSRHSLAKITIWIHACLRVSQL